MDSKVKARLTWIELYQQTLNAGLVCRRCGVSRTTLRKWLKRFAQFGLDGLQDQSRRPKRCPRLKVLEQHKAWILQLRTERRLSARRIQSELLRLHGFSLSLATIHKVLTHAEVKPLHATRKPRKGTRRYQKDVPGERVQMDVCKIGPKLYQYTAIDDCTRLKVVKLYSKKAAVSTLDFIDQIVVAFPFPVQRIQTDRGQEFMAGIVQKRLMQQHIKFRPIKPYSPHLNGKVERTQRTDWEEFYSLADLRSLHLAEQLQQWQDYYNRERRHGSLAKTPWQKWQELTDKVPTLQQVQEIYSQKREYCRSNIVRQVR